jgi:hypothetical protein
LTDLTARDTNCWVVDLEQRCVVVHRDPGADGYRSVVSIPSGEPVQARSLELGLLPTGELFAAALPASR